MCSVLFTDGMRAGIRDITAAWRLPGRALLVGLPLTLLITALLGHALAALPWLIALLVGAILCPTDPVFAAAIVGREEVPARLRFLLNVESGINDGLALPIVLGLLGVVGHESAGFLRLSAELLWELRSVCCFRSAFVGWKRAAFGVAKPFEPLFAFSIGLLVLAVAAATRQHLSRGVRRRQHDRTHASGFAQRIS